MGRRPISEAMNNLPAIPEDTPIGQVYSVPRAATVFGVSFKTLYNAIESQKLLAYRAPTMGNREDEKVVRGADVVAFRATLRADKRRGAGITSVDKPDSLP